MIIVSEMIIFYLIFPVSILLVVVFLWLADRKDANSDYKIRHAAADAAQAAPHAQRLRELDKRERIARWKRARIQARMKVLGLHGCLIDMGWGYNRVTRSFIHSDGRVMSEIDAQADAQMWTNEWYMREDSKI